MGIEELVRKNFKEAIVNRTIEDELVLDALYYLAEATTSAQEKDAINYLVKSVTEAVEKIVDELVWYVESGEYEREPREP